MTEYRFRLILSGPFSSEVTDDELLDATDALGAAGCDDASISNGPQILDRALSGSP